MGLGKGTAVKAYLSVCLGIECYVFSHRPKRLKQWPSRVMHITFLRHLVRELILDPNSQDHTANIN